MNKEYFSLEQLSQMTGYTQDYIRKEVFTSMGEFPQSHSILGGYHNTQKFYDIEVAKAIKAYQIKAHNNMLNKEQANKTTADILNKAEQMMDLQVIADSGNVEAMKQFMNRMVSYTEAKAQTKLLQKENTELKIENSKLKEEAIKAYNEGFEEGRYRLNWMYRYDNY